MIDVNNPEKYISKAKAKRKALLLKSNLKMYGTPLSIGSVSLKIKFKDLEQLLIEQFEKNKNIG